MAWLLMGEKLKTQDKLNAWDINAGLATVCSFFYTTADSHEHLFFLCPYAMQVWRFAKGFIDIPSTGSTWKDVVQDFSHVIHRKTMNAIVAKLLFGASVYYIWQERNARLFSRKSRSPKDVCDLIYSTVRLKIMAIRWKDSSRVRNMKIVWKVS
ncbi:uncharacterized protein [Rutidosis leptorrhynchoides]|uniref:uncharacterized protein n=1 Tax=Rutidosis leptorrhynchoides TaxID=125765 RepID=UPI003A99DE0F